MWLLTALPLTSFSAKQLEDEAEQAPLKCLYQPKFALHCQEG